MPSIDDIITFQDDAPPPGESAWVIASPPRHIEVVASDPTWPAQFERMADRLRDVLGPRALEIIHIGSTSVPGLAAKPIIDIDLIVADPADEAAWLPPLEAAGYVLTIREPWWHQHRLVKAESPAGNIHVFGPDSPEPWKNRIFRDHLRRNESDRNLYAETKRRAAEASNAGGESTMDYNRRKQEVIREIYARAFVAAGLIKVR